MKSSLKGEIIGVLDIERRPGHTDLSTYFPSEDIKGWGAYNVELKRVLTGEKTHNVGMFGILLPVVRCDQW